MKIWLCLVLFMCLGLATSLKCLKCKNGCSEKEEVECPGCDETFWNGKLLRRECSTSEIASYTCTDADEKDGGQTGIRTTCSCGEELCNDNLFPLQGKCKDGKCSGGGVGPTPWNNLLWIGLGLAFFIMH